MAERERRFLPAGVAGIEIDTRDDESPRLRGLAAVYYDGTEATEYELYPGVVERVQRGAFSALLKSGPDIRALFNHDPDNLLGRTTNGTLSLRSTNRGLEFELMPPDTQVGRDVAMLVGRGDLSGSSYSFVVADESWSRDKERDVDVRTIKSFEAVYDVGPVTFPAYSATEVALRSHDTWRRAQQAVRAEDEIRRRRLRLRRMQ